MRYIYLSVVIFLLLGSLLFVGSFVCLDMVNHKTFYFVIQSLGRDIGMIRVDRFLTEDKIIYKSVTSMPLESLYTEYRSRLVLDKKYNLESYTKERVSGRSVDSIYLENFKNLISFVSRYQSKFTCSENIPIKRDIFVFEEDSPMTYLPIIENYNFSRGRSQGFNTISYLQSWNIPPMNRLIILTSIKNEHIKIGARKINTENLILKIRDFPQGAIWLGRSDRSIMKIDLPAKGINIVRTFTQKSLKIVDAPSGRDGFSSKNVLFKSKSTDLSGTVTFPSREGKFPAVLLSPGAGPQDRDYQGLFVGMASYLSRNGFACLRFDKRGVGSSGGEVVSSTEASDIEDLGSALQCLSGQSMVDPDRIIIIGHGRGAINAMKFASKNSGVKGLIMMSPSPYPYSDGMSNKEDLEARSQKAKWTDDYLNLVIKTTQDSKIKTANSEGDWTYILGKRCFLGSMREDILGGLTAEIIDLQIPILILQGKDAEEIYGNSAVTIDKMLALSGKTQHTLTYYAYLGPFFGQKISDGIHRAYYDVDKEVLDNIRNWLCNTLIAKPAVSVEK